MVFIKCAIQENLVVSMQCFLLIKPDRNEKHASEHSECGLVMDSRTFGSDKHRTLIFKKP